MIKVKDGYAKLIGTTYSGNVSRVLLSNGGDHILGNSNGNIPLNNGTVNTNLNADMLDGLHIHAGRNHEVNKIVRTDANGHILAGWINTTSGDIGTGTINKIYCSNDDYIRYKTPANFFPTLANSGNDISITVAGLNRTLTVGYATNTDKVDGYHANTVYNAPSFTINNSNTSNTYILLATITIDGTSLGCAEFTILFQNRECLDNSSFILSGAIRRSSTTSVTATLSYITLHTKTPRNIYLRSDDGVTFMVYILSATGTWTTFYRAIPIVDSGNITYSNTGIASPISGSVLNITATKGGNTNYANSAGNADTLNNYHASGLLTALSNSNNGVSITVGGTTKNINNISVSYALYLNSVNRMDYGWNGINYFNASLTAGCAAKANDSPTSNWWHILRFNHKNSEGYYTDLAVPFNNNSLYWKTVRNGAIAYDHWIKVLDSLNYNEFAPTKTGGGASGTWGISITGNAATASKLGTSTIGATNIPIYLNGGTPTVVNLNSTANNLINNLSEGTSTPTDADYYVSQYVGGGTTTITYHRRPHSALYAYIKGKAEGTWGISITGNATSATNADKVDGYHASSFLIDRSDAYTGLIYDLPCKSIFSGSKLSDAPVTNDWVSGIVLGSNWNSSHYLHYLVESGSRWYATRAYSDGKMTKWNTFAYLTDNVASASKWQTARKVILTGSVTGSVSIDGSGDVTLTTTTNHTHNWTNIEGKPSTFAPSSHTHSYITIPTCSSLDGNSNNFSVEYAGGNNSVITKPSGVDAFGVMRLRTASGWYGLILMSNSKGIYYRSANGLTSSINWIKLLDSSNSNVSGGGNAWGSSITVNINGTSKTLTIPNNPNTDYRVTQSETTTANYRPLVLGYTNVSTAGSGMTGSITNQVYLSNKFYVQPSTGNLYATTFIGALSGNATTASKWAKSCTLTIGNTGKDVDGSANVSWTLAEIGAATSGHTHSTITFNNEGSGGASGSTYNSSAALIVSYNTVGARRDLAPNNGAWFTGTPKINRHGIMEIGRYIDFHPTHTSSLDYSVRLDATTSTTQRWINLPDASGTLELVGHTHTLTLDSDTGDNPVALTYGGKYKLTAGGSSVIFTLPTDNNTAHTKFAWTNGSITGPTGSLSGNHTAVSFPAIPSATASISGIVTTGTLTFAGNKTFNGHITLGSGYQLKRAAYSSSWYNGRDRAIIRQTSANEYSVVVSSKTTNGSWEIGNRNNNLYFTYITDTNYNSANNVWDARLYFDTSGSFYATNLNASDYVYSANINVSDTIFTNNIDVSNDVSVGNDINVTNYIYATHFYENSDIRYKKILRNLSINSNTIANLPLFDFEWIENNAIGTGTSALAVQQILPNLVSGTDKLTLDYGVLGTIAGITACKELVTLKSELLQLKEKIKLLEDKLRKYENI